jgi:hypothetical protein
VGDAWFQSHHPKDPSYYPLLAHLAQTGQILRLKNRPGNVHDSKGAEAFMRELIDELRARLGRSLVLELRMDAAFSSKSVQTTGWARLFLCGQGPVFAIDRSARCGRRTKALGVGAAPHHLLRDPA